MSKSQLIQYLYDEINRQNTWYMWTVVFLVGLFGFLEIRISNKQLGKFKIKIKNDLIKEFNLDLLERERDEDKKKIQQLFDELNTLKQQVEFDKQKAYMSGISRLLNTTYGLTKFKEHSDESEVAFNKLMADLIEFYNDLMGNVVKYQFLNQMLTSINEILKTENLNNKSEILHVKQFLEDLKQSRDELPEEMR